MAGEEKEKSQSPAGADSKHNYLLKFFLFETCSNFYMIGRDKTKSHWRVLKIGRSEPLELNIVEDPTVYTEQECVELIKRLREGNKLSGGLKLVTSCYGIIGFIKFLGPYYMLLITKREKIGTICGHPIYTITETTTIPIPNSSVLSDMALSKDESRYKKLLCVLDLRKDFFFSYSYNIMCSLQKNRCDNETGQMMHETMFVWNAYLTREIRNNIRSNLWTVALVYGFFKQVKLSVCGREFNLILIARRSRHYAGTRYLKRGVNEKGRVANDVETEQIITEDALEGCPIRISSIVQHRGSIPLFWSQESSPLNLRPAIKLSEKDPHYEVARLHFENLSRRYGNPIVILDLIKTCEEKPRESLLHTEFLKAVRFLNKGQTEENSLRFFHLDLHRYSRSRRATNALSLLLSIAKRALNLTGLFCHEIMPDVQPGISVTSSSFKNIDGDGCKVPKVPSRGGNGSIHHFQNSKSNGDDGDPEIFPMMVQNGVLRTNCIDCIDRTNVAQYAYGLVALGRQLHVLGLLGFPEIDLDNPLAEDLMGFYETMGDTLALQYGGSAAHNKIFCETRGQWKPATQSQEILRTVQRYFSNSYTDPGKQDAINLFLGYFQPQMGKPAIWELDSDPHHFAGRQIPGYDGQNASSLIKRSFSDGNILSGSDVHQAIDAMVQNPLPGTAHGGSIFSNLSPQISVGEPDIPHCRYTPSFASRQPLKGISDEPENDSSHYREYGKDCDSSDFLDLEWLSSSETLYREDSLDWGQRIRWKGSPPHGSTEKVGRWNQIDADGSEVSYSDDFIRWVAEGGTLSADLPKLWRTAKVNITPHNHLLPTHEEKNEATAECEE